MPVFQRQLIRALQQEHQQLGGGGVSKTRTAGGGGSKSNKCTSDGLLGLRVIAVLTMCIAAFFLRLMIQVGLDDSVDVSSSSSSSSSLQQMSEQQHQQRQQQPHQQQTMMKHQYATPTPIQHTVIAYAISLVKCGDHQSSASGLTDAALVMRHSIHLQSSRNSKSGSKYDYKMYAIVHKDAEECSGILKTVGFELLLVDPPVVAEDIRGDFLRRTIHREWCCGSDEFIKLYAYHLIPEPIVVHVDIDFAFFQPMDDLYDAILYDKDSPQGQAARKRIAMQLERPREDTLPDTIGAFITRDWPQVNPGRKAMFQAGFLVARRDPTILPEVIQVIQEGNYTAGYGRDNGWGGGGYGGYVGSMAMQGLMAYYYDMVRPNTAVELNQCRYNHMGMNVLYEYAPNFSPRRKKTGSCRNNRGTCEDCRKTNLTDIYNVHYTQCRKPWNCVGIGYPGGTTPQGRAQGKKADAIDTHAGDYEHCMMLITKWHEIRADFEQGLYSLTHDEFVRQGSTGTHKNEIFQGHCLGEGGENYLNINATEESFHQVPKLYE